MRLGLGIGISRQQRASGGGPPAFTPADVFTAGVDGVWSDRITVADLWQDVARTTPVTAAGQPVGSWRVNTSSGVTYLQQGTAGLRPIYRENGSGAGYLEFDGVDDFLDSAGTFSAPLNTQESTLFAAVDIDGSFIDNATIVSYWPVLTSFGSHRYMNMNPSGLVKADTAGGGNSALGPAMPTNFCVPEAKFETQVSSALNGGAFTTITPASPVTTGPNNRFRVGRAIDGTAMKIYGAIHVVKVLTSGERASLISWLTALENP